VKGATRAAGALASWPGGRGWTRADAEPSVLIP
jgi:hypothetical protein